MEKNEPTTHPARATVPSAVKYAAAGFVAVVFACGGFLGGMQYQKVADQNNGSGIAQTNSGGSFNQRSGNFNGARRAGNFGTVTSVSSTSITIALSGGRAAAGTTKTYTINNSTTITSGGSSASVGDVHTGDRVMIRVSSSDVSVAASITINPSLRGMPGGQAQSSQDEPSNNMPTDSSST